MIYCVQELASGELGVRGEQDPEDVAHGNNVSRLKKLHGFVVNVMRCACETYTHYVNFDLFME